jgi:hypothetical protein
MKPEDALTSSQKSLKDYYTEPHGSNSYPQALFFKCQF